LRPTVSAHPSCDLGVDYKREEEFIKERPDLCPLASLASGAIRTSKTPHLTALSAITTLQNLLFFYTLKLAFN
jgi:hypothetical protein